MENRDIREQEIMDAVSAFEMMLREQINRNEKMRKGRKGSMRVKKLLVLQPVTE